MITAHGVSDRERRRLTEAGKELIDTTCPLVTRVHRAAQGLVAEGRHVVVIGRPGHVEVRGIVEDLPTYDVFPSVESVRRLPFEKLGVVCQTTTPPRLADEVLAALRQANPEAEIQAIDTICHPTRDRQRALLDLLPLVEALVVVGGRNSNNTRELVRLGEEHGVRVLHVESAQELSRAWFRGVTTVGLTAGTSTLDTTVDEVERQMLMLASDDSLETADGK
jgi:4-hydroxy-3-methylbut-2-enyl diphosphate reductase